jgi:ribonuclease P protein component
VATEPRTVVSGPTLWRITDRRTFSALRRDGRRARSGAIAVTWLPAPPEQPATPPRAAFAVTRPSGGAVVRNRIRRRLRAALRELHAAGSLPDGTYLLSAGPEARTLPWPDLVARLSEAIASATRVPSR